MAAMARAPREPAGGLLRSRRGTDASASASAAASAAHRRPPQHVWAAALISSPSRSKNGGGSIHLRLRRGRPAAAVVPAAIQVPAVARVGEDGFL